MSFAIHLKTVSVPEVLNRETSTFLLLLISPPWALEVIVTERLTLHCLSFPPLHSPVITKEGKTKLEFFKKWDGKEL